MSLHARAPMFEDQRAVGGLLRRETELTTVGQERSVQELS